MPHKFDTNLNIATQYMANMFRFIDHNCCDKSYYKEEVLGVSDGTEAGRGKATTTSQLSIFSNSYILNY